MRKRLKFCWLAVAAWLCISLSLGLAAYLPVDPASPLVSQAELSSSGNLAGRHSLEQQAKLLYGAGRFAEAASALQQAVLTYQQQKEPVQQAIALQQPRRH